MKNLYSASLLILVALILTFYNSCKKDDSNLIPILTTLPVSEITGNTAICGGIITSDRGFTITSRGVCWTTAIKPTVTDSITNDGGGAGSFTSSISGLTAATTYFVRAYARNGSGTGYGMTMSFTTLGQIPAVQVSPATNISISEAKLNGSVNANYVSTNVFFEYGETTSYGNSISGSPSSVNGNSNTLVSCSISGLSHATLYHYRIKSDNSLGTSYSNDMSFTTLGLLPSSTTQTASNITINSVVLNGSVNSNYLLTSIAFEYGLDQNYGNLVIASPSSFSGSTEKNVTAIIENLDFGTIYHYRVKADNELGTAYGNDMTFTTLGKIPTTTTLNVTDILKTRAVLIGNVNPNYLATEVSFEYGLTSSYGIIVNATQTPLSGSSNEVVTVEILNLIPDNIYHYRVTATNDLGTSNGNDMTFITSVLDIDGNKYDYVAIGNQIWMTENLKTTKYNDGTIIPQYGNWMNLFNPAFCWYDNNETNKTPYGGLYNWYAVKTGILCPTGWHVPNEQELSTLITVLGGEYLAGGKLKESGLNHWSNPNTDATNDAGFYGLPGGFRADGGNFIEIGNYGIWWSSSIQNNDRYWCLILSFDSGRSLKAWNSGTLGSSVRCIKD